MASFSAKIASNVSPMLLDVAHVQSSTSSALNSHCFVSLPKRKPVLCSLIFHSYHCPSMQVTALHSILHPEKKRDSTDTQELHPEKKRDPPDTQELHSKLKIGIVGFGNFAQFLAKAIIKQGHSVVATSRSDYADLSHRLGITFFRDPNDFCEEYPDVILLCTSILSTESTLRALPLQRLKKKTLFVDVLSVKEFPRNLFLELLPPDCEILCTHPMFGPESGKESWAGLPFVFDKVRVSEGGYGAEKCREFLKIFEAEGCRMVEMSCAEHDRYAAGSQFVTHTVGRILSQLNLESTPINTKGYESLLQLMENTTKDSFDLYYGLFMYNLNATEQIEKLDRAFEAVKQNLYGRLHDTLKRQLVERVPARSPSSTSPPTTSYLPSAQNLEGTTDFVPSSVSSSPSSSLSSPANEISCRNQW